MTQIIRTERYESNACMDREDADAMSAHLLALAAVLADNGGNVAIDACGHEIGLHYARLVRILQRATQPDVVGRVPCSGVERIALYIENGARTFTIRTPRADIVIDADRRRVSLDGPVGQVVSIDRYEQRRRA